MADSKEELQALIIQCARSGTLDLPRLGHLQVLVQASIAQEIANRGGALGDPRRFDPPPRAPSAAEVLRSPAASAWVKSAVRRGMKGDILAAYIDAALVAAVLRYEESVSDD
jgi:hypothetical protein